MYPPPSTVCRGDLIRDFPVLFCVLGAKIFTALKYISALSAAAAAGSRGGGGACGVGVDAAALCGMCHWMGMRAPRCCPSILFFSVSETEQNHDTSHRLTFACILVVLPTQGIYLTARLPPAPVLRVATPQHGICTRPL